MKQILNKCPLCGAELEYQTFNQYCNVYRILKNGTVSKTRKRKIDAGTVEAAMLSCSECGFSTNVEFEPYGHEEIKIDVDKDGVFTIEILEE